MMSAEDEMKLTRWMDDHAMVMWTTTPAPWHLEKELLKHGPTLPLNIQGSRNPYCIPLKSQRAALNRSPMCADGSTSSSHSTSRQHPIRG
jgi:hypothetical protein